MRNGRVTPCTQAGRQIRRVLGYPRSKIRIQCRLSRCRGRGVKVARLFARIHRIAVAYFAKYPRVREFRERVVAQAAEDGYVTTLFGRRRAVPELRSRNWNERSLGERLAVNTVLQGTAADIIKVAMVRLERELARRKMASRLVLQVHDELILESPEAEADAGAALLREVMCGAYEMDPPLEVEVGAGRDWLAAKG